MVIYFGKFYSLRKIRTQQNTWISDCITNISKIKNMYLISILALSANTVSNEKTYAIDNCNKHENIF